MLLLLLYLLMLLSLRPNVVVGVAAITHADVASVVQTPVASNML